MSILLGILVGLALPVQTSVNNKLRDKVGTPYNASLVSFIISTVFLACLLLVTGQGFHLPMDQLAGEPFWVWLGGLCGVVFLTANVILLTKLGSAETVILPVLGQLLMGLLVDSLGLFRAQQIPLTPLRAVGAVLVLAGVMVVAWSGQAAAAQGQRQQEELSSYLEEQYQQAGAPPAGCGCGASWGWPQGCSAPPRRPSTATWARWWAPP